MWLMKTLLTSGCVNQRGAGQWNDAGLNSQGYFNYDRAAKSINALGFASATENKDWNNSSIGEAGWMLNGAGEKVTWFNNGLFMAFQIG